MLERRSHYLDCVAEKLITSKDGVLQQIDTLPLNTTFSGFRTLFSGVGKECAGKKSELKKLATKLANALTEYSFTI